MSWYDWAIAVFVAVAVVDTVRDTIATKRYIREISRKTRELERWRRTQREGGQMSYRAACATTERALQSERDDRNRLRLALATSQADVTRLVAELAESTRALAVSQGEVERTAVELARVKRIYLEDCTAWHEEVVAVRGDLERARGLLRETVPNGGEHLPDDWTDRRDAFLAPPTPTASPEPDRASPEVTVKENDR